jgi:hypothetical protein
MLAQLLDQDFNTSMSESICHWSANHYFTSLLGSKVFGGVPTSLNMHVQIFFYGIALRWACSTHHPFFY